MVTTTSSWGHRDCCYNNTHKSLRNSWTINVVRHDCTIRQDCTIAYTCSDIVKDAIFGHYILRMLDKSVQLCTHVVIL